MTIPTHILFGVLRVFQDMSYKLLLLLERRLDCLCLSVTDEAAVCLEPKFKEKPCEDPLCQVENLSRRSGGNMAARTKNLHGL